MQLRFLPAAGLALVATASLANAQAKQQGKAADNNTALNAVKAALDKYKDPIVAIREGYLSTVGCVDFPTGGAEHGSMEYKPGAMGVHFINMGLVGPKLDSTKPPVPTVKACANWRTPASSAFAVVSITSVSETPYFARSSGST